MGNFRMSDLLYFVELCANKDPRWVLIQPLLKKHDDSTSDLCFTTEWNENGWLGRFPTTNVTNITDVTDITDEQTLCVHWSLYSENI